MRLIAEAADGDDGEVFCIAEAVSEAVDVDADGGGGGLGGGAPDVIHELQAGKYLVGVG